MQPRKMVSISDNHCITVSERVRKTVSLYQYQKWRMETWSKAQGLDPAHIKQGFVHRGSCGNWLLLAQLMDAAKQSMTPARNPKQWFFSPSGMLDGQLAWGAIWTKKCWFSIVNIDVWARNLAFRLDETRASVTKYWFFLIKMSGRAPRAHPRPLPSVSWKAVRTPQCKHCLGNYTCLMFFSGTV